MHMRVEARTDRGDRPILHRDFAIVLHARYCIIQVPPIRLSSPSNFYSQHLTLTSANFGIVDERDSFTLALNPLTTRMFFSAIAASAFAAMASAQTIVTSSAASVAASTTVSQSMPPTATAGFNPTGYGVNDTVTCKDRKKTSARRVD